MAWRLIVAGMILFFAWRGTGMEMPWPAADQPKAAVDRPDSGDLKAAEGVKVIAAKMSPADRIYLANFYAALVYIVNRDAKRDQPILTDTAKFQTFHSGSLDAIIDRKDIGKNPGLGEAIDAVFKALVGDSVQAVSPAVREKIVRSCSAISWTLAIHGE